MCTKPEKWYNSTRGKGQATPIKRLKGRADRHRRVMVRDMSEKVFNGIVEVNGKKVRYTACIAERFSHFIDDEHAIAAAVVLDYIGQERIKEEAKRDALNIAINTNDTLAAIVEYLESVKAPRKPREMSNETRLKNQVIKLSRAGLTVSQISTVTPLSESEIIEILRAKNFEGYKE